MDPSEIPGWIQAISGLGMIGAGMWMIIKRDPAREAAYREEREAQDKAHREEREAMQKRHDAAVAAIRDEHAKDRAEWREILKAKDEQLSRRGAQQ